MAKRKLTSKQIAAGFGGKRRRKAARRGSSARPAKVVERRSGTRMARKKGKRRGGRRGFNVMRAARGIAGVNAALQLGEPIARQALPPLMSGDLAGAIAGARAGSREAVTGRNLMEAFVPSLTVEAVGTGLTLVRRFRRAF